jgi:MFS family permease
VLAIETAPSRPGATASLRPRVRVPARARRQFAAAVPALVGSWMMAALFMGLGPSILGAVFGIHNVGVDGATSSIEPLVAAVAAFLTGSLAAHQTLIVGTVSVIAGAALVIIATATGVLPLLLLGGAVGGVGFGATFSGALRALAPLAQAHERAGLFAAIFMVSYLAFGLPAIVAGQLVAPLGVLRVAAAFGAAIAVTAAIGLGGQVQLLRQR